MKVVHTLVLAAAVVLLACQTRADDTKAVIDKNAPGFTLTDINGKKLSLNDFKGRYVVLEWINFDCPFVRKHYGSGNMQNLQKSYAEQGVVWLTICSSSPGKQGYFEAQEIKDRLSSLEASPTAYLIDADGKVGRMYGAKTTPHMFIIDPRGILIYAGGIDDTPSADKEDIGNAENYVRNALDESMAGKSITVKTSKPYGCSVKY